MRFILFFCGKDQRVAAALLLCCCRHAGVKGDRQCNMCSANIWLIRTLCKQFTRRFYVCSHAGVKEVRVQELNITRHLCGRMRVCARACVFACACVHACDWETINQSLHLRGRRENAEEDGADVSCRLLLCLCSNVKLSGTFSPPCSLPCLRSWQNKCILWLRAPCFLFIWAGESQRRWLI